MSKCDHCNNPAVVHEVVIRGGKTSEVHLCAEHAAKAGYIVPGGPQVQVLSQVVTVTTQPAGTAAQRACHTCGLTFARFRQTGTLGCPACYEAFHEQLSSIIERAQAGAVHHTGKTPRRRGTALDTAALRQKLVKELSEAVAAEQYERAARLRDRISELSGKARGSDRDSDRGHDREGTRDTGRETR